MAKPSFGLTLPNRGVVTGATTVPEMLGLAAKADTSGVWDSVWVGDSIFAKPRLDALTLMAAIAARTERVKIGPACMASTPLRDARLLAYQWCSLDHLSGGRTIFVACQGGPRADAGRFHEEFAAFGIEPRSRMKRMEEAIEISLRRVARLGDGWMTTENIPESFAQHLALIRGYAEQQGRSLGDGFEAA